MAFAPMLMMAAGTGMSALSTYRQGQYQSNQAKAAAEVSDYNAQVADADAAAIKQKSIFDQIRSVQSGARKVSSLRVGQTEENIGEVIQVQAYENALDTAMIGYEGLVGAGKQRSAAAMYRNSAANQRSQSKYAKESGKWGAVTKLLTGFGSMAMMGGFGGGRTPNLSTSYSNAGVAPAPSILSGQR